MSTEPRWQTARIGDIPAAGLSAGPGYWKEWTDDEGYPTRWHSVREHFGIEAFGVNACHGEAGQEVIVPQVRVHNFSVSLDGSGTGEGQSPDAPFGHAGRQRSLTCWNTWPIEPRKAMASRLRP